MSNTVMKMKKMLVVILTFAMLAAIIPAIASASEEHGMGQNHGGKAMIGGFTYSNGFVNGTFVNFNIDEKSGVITSYKVNGTEVFEKVSYSSADTGKIRLHGAMLMYYGIGAGTGMNWSHHNIFNVNWRLIAVHDNPAGAMHIVVYGNDGITYTLANGESANITGRHIITISGEESGHIIYTGTASISGNEIHISFNNTDFTFGNHTYHGGSAIFIGAHGWHFNHRLRQMIINAIEKGKMGGELRIQKNKADFMNYTYGLNARVKMNKENHVQVTVESENHEGKVIMLTFNKSNMQYGNNHKIIVKIDGKKIQLTNDTNVFSGGTEGKYAVYSNGNQVTVFVYIPHFSDHTVDVESESQSNIATVAGNPAYIGAIIGVIVVIIIAAVIIIRKR